MNIIKKFKDFANTIKLWPGIAKSKALTEPKWKIWFTLNFIKFSDINKNSLPHERKLHTHRNSFRPFRIYEED